MTRMNEVVGICLHRALRSSVFFGGGRPCCLDAAARGDGVDERCDGLPRACTRLASSAALQRFWLSLTRRKPVGGAMQLLQS